MVWNSLKKSHFIKIASGASYTLSENPEFGPKIPKIFFCNILMINKFYLNFRGKKSILGRQFWTKFSNETFFGNFQKRWKNHPTFKSSLRSLMRLFFEDFATLCPFFKCMSFDVQRVTLKTVEAGLDFLRGSSS